MAEKRRAHRTQATTTRAGNGVSGVALGGAIVIACLRCLPAGPVQKGYGHPVTARVAGSNLPFPRFVAVNPSGYLLTIRTPKEFFFIGGLFAPSGVIASNSAIGRKIFCVLKSIAIVRAYF